MGEGIAKGEIGLGTRSSEKSNARVIRQQVGWAGAFRRSDIPA